MFVCPQSRTEAELQLTWPFSYTYCTTWRLCHWDQACLPLVPLHCFRSAKHPCLENDDHTWKCKCSPLLLSLPLSLLSQWWMQGKTCSKWRCVKVWGSEGPSASVVWTSAIWHCLLQQIIYHCIICTKSPLLWVYERASIHTNSPSSNVLSPLSELDLALPSVCQPSYYRSHLISFSAHTLHTW